MKKKNSSRLLIIIGIVIFCISVSLIVITSLTTPDKETTLTAIEKRWVESNKNKVIDIAVTNNIPMFSYEGNGIFYDYLEEFEKKINLSFNIISYDYGEKPSMQDYNFEVVNNPSKDQLVFYEDSYVLLSTDKNRINDPKSLENKNIGVLNNKFEDANYYLNYTNSVITSFDDQTKMFEELDNKKLDYILLPYTLYINETMKGDLFINYKFKDIVDNYVITLSKTNNTVNNIMKKYVELWLNNKYTEVYNNYFNKQYNEQNEISSKTLAEFRNKDYVYGYTDNLPYENVVNNRMIGINGEYITKYSNLSKINFKYKKYSSESDLISAFNRGEVDIMFNDVSTAPSSGTIRTASVYNEEYVILTDINNITSIESIRSLKDKTIYVKDNSALLNYVNSNVEAKVIPYSTNEKLFSSLKDNMIIVIDAKTYEYYKNSEFSKYKVSFKAPFKNEYSFLINNKQENKLFINNFNYYILGLSENVINNIAYKNLITNPKYETLAESILNYILYYVLPIFIAVIVITIIFKKKKKKAVIKKDERLRYIDQLTSLKNRNYLNSKIKEWDEAKIYPQTIIIADLNNVKYINDNFGHEEGDNTIKAAANILINTQKENSDIIRTDGNEFLVYLIGYTEDEVISYMKLLYKEFKDLPHGKGASIGYSIINDDLKLVGDAINEATLDMRTNKETSV